jgi:hypothetical protein
VALLIWLSGADLANVGLKIKFQSNVNVKVEFSGNNLIEI